MNKKFMLTVFMVLAGALVLAGCGQQGQQDKNVTPNVTDEPETTEPVEEEPEAQIVETTLDEWGVELSESTVEAGKVKFEVANSGALRHEFEIEGNGVEEVVEGGIPAGESRTLTLDLEPGTYEVYCPIPGNPSHRDRGMEATLTVE